MANLQLIPPSTSQSPSPPLSTIPSPPTYIHVPVQILYTTNPSDHIGRIATTCLETISLYPLHPIIGQTACEKWVCDLLKCMKSWPRFCKDFELGAVSDVVPMILRDPYWTEGSGRGGRKGIGETGKSVLGRRLEVVNERYTFATVGDLLGCFGYGVGVGAGAGGAGQTIYLRVHVKEKGGYYNPSTETISTNSIDTSLDIRPTKKIKDREAPDHNGLQRIPEVEENVRDMLSWLEKHNKKKGKRMEPNDETWLRRIYLRKWEERNEMEMKKETGDEKGVGKGGKGREELDLMDLKEG